MAFQLIQSAQARWGAGTPHLVALVRASATFEKGILVERPLRITRGSAKPVTEPWS
jgi:putative transposase